MCPHFPYLEELDDSMNKALMHSSDIEIYIRDVDTETVSRWLSARFDRVDLNIRSPKSVAKGVVYLDDLRIPVTLFPEAHGKHYLCVLFESPDAPWEDDLACARELFQMLGKEVRCSTGGWQEGEDPEDEFWWRIDESGEEQVRWR